MRYTTAWWWVREVGSHHHVVSPRLRETAVDANEPPFPTVNIIADHVKPEFAKTYQWGSAQSAQRSLLEKSADAQQRFEAASVVHLQAQNRQLDNLRGLNARASVSAWDVKHAHH